MKNEQWLDYNLLCGLSHFKMEEKTLKKIKDPVIQQLQELI
jgi:hypothetical protein